MVCDDRGGSKKLFITFGAIVWECVENMLGVYYRHVTNYTTIIIIFIIVIPINGIMCDGHRSLPGQWRERVTVIKIQWR